MNLQSLRSKETAPRVADLPLPLLDAASLLSERDFGTVRQLIAQYAGIKLSPQKRNRVYNRLQRRLRARGMASFGDYLELVQREGSDEREAFVNALTTNLTAFFREPHHFELLHAHAVKHGRRGRPLGPNPHASTKSPTPMLNALPVSRPIAMARPSTATSLGDMETQPPGAARFSRDRSESAFQFDIWSSTAVTAPASSATIERTSVPSDAWKRAV